LPECGPVVGFAGTSFASGELVAARERETFRVCRALLVSSTG